MGNVIFVAEYQLDCVDARLQFERGFRLAFAEMKVIFVRENIAVKFRLSFFSFTKRGTIEEDMMVTGIGCINTGGCNSHALKPKDNFYRAFDLIIVFEIDKIDH